jgi:hypothetical protein
MRYYLGYQLIFIFIFTVVTSVGAFFHFLLNHEISIVESWLHNNHWEILILSKLFSVYLINQWFKVKLYELKRIRDLIRELVGYPEPRAIVLSFFMLSAYLALSGLKLSPQNMGYTYNHMASYLGIFLYFGIEFVVISYLEDVLNVEKKPNTFSTALVYLILFIAAFRLSIPDYYGMLPFMVLGFSTLIFLSGPFFKNWGNVVFYLICFIAPMGAIFGLDPVWGDDFSLFRLKTKLSLSFLVIIWMISFAYYKYRKSFIQGAKKLLR